MTELDVINDCFATMGEAPLVELSEDHPLTAGARRILTNMNEAVQSEGWWFNKERITLFADALSNFIYVPMDAIRCDPVMSTYGGAGNHLPIVQRERRLYDTETNSYVFNGSIDCILIRLIPFSDLPPSAQRLISLSTVRKFQQNYDADQARSQQLEMEYREARMQLNAEHTRNVKANFIARNSTIRSLYNIGGGIRRRGGGLL